MDSSDSQLPLPSVTSFEDHEGAVLSNDHDEDDELEVEDEKSKKDKTPKTEQELLFCKYCDFQAMNLKIFVNHVHRPSHLKKATEAYNIRFARDVTPRIFNCQDCLISCNGENAWNQHLVGQKHRKVLEKKSFQLAEQKQQVLHPGQRKDGGGPIKSNQYSNTYHKKPYEKIQKTVRQPNDIPTEALGAKDFEKYEEPLIGLEYVTEIQVIGQSPRYHCSLCDSKFDHNLKFPHLVGAKHRMNVLKIKKPQVLQDSRSTTQKRSELTAMLLREAKKLEEEEGRKQVKTKVEKSPFTAVENATRTSSGRGRGSTFRAGPSSRGTRGNRGARGAIGGDRGHRGAARGTRGNQGGRGRSSNFRDDYRQQDYDYPKFNLPYNESFDKYMASYSSSFDRPSGYPTLSKYSSSQTGNYTSPYYDDYTNAPSYGSAPSYGNIPSYGNAPTYGNVPTYGNPPQENYSRPKQNDGHPNPAPSNAAPVDAQQTEAGQKPDFSSGLASALGDLTKLVQNEDDASVALHVSNALTQALLQYRMVNIQEEGGSSSS